MRGGSYGLEFRTPTSMSLRFCFLSKRSRPKSLSKPGRVLFSREPLRAKDTLGVADALDEVGPPRQELTVIIHDEFTSHAHLDVAALLPHPEEVTVQVLLNAGQDGFC
jgi:hypothetical protein